MISEQWASGEGMGFRPKEQLLLPLTGGVWTGDGRQPPFADMGNTFFNTLPESEPAETSPANDSFDTYAYRIDHAGGQGPRQRDNGLMIAAG